MTQVRPLLPGDPREVSGYLLHGRLGAGGMGTVYLSTTRGGQPVAVKVVPPALAEDPKFRRRFEREVSAARRVRGRYIVPVLDSNTDAALPWLVSEYVPGNSLARALATHGPLGEVATLQLVAGVAHALETIHAGQVIHRDLKPANVLLAADGPAVIDFGIARAAEATPLTGTDLRIGTPAFMAPEQIRSNTGLTGAIDVFALGLTGFLAATGSHPFGEGATPLLLYRIDTEEPDLSRCPPALAPVVTRCLAKDPADRPTPAEVVALCRDAAAGLGLTEVLPTTGWLPEALTGARDVPHHPPTVPVDQPGYGPAPGPPPTGSPAPQPHPALRAETRSAPPPPLPSPGPRRGKRKVLAVVAGVLAVALATWAAVSAIGGDDDDGASAKPTASVSHDPEPSRSRSAKPPAPEPPQPVGTVVFINPATEDCLDSNEDGEVYAEPCNSGPYQRWELSEAGELMNVKTRMCLDTSNNASTQTCQPQQPSQVWKIDEAGSLSSGGLCLDVDFEEPDQDLERDVVYAITCEGTENQEWELRTVDNRIRNTAAGGCLADGSEVTVEVCDEESRYQQWESAGAGTLRNRETGQCLAVGTPMITRTCDQADEEQHWQVGTDTMDRERLVSSLTEECLTASETEAPGLATCDDGDHQAWGIEKPTPAT